MSILQRLKGKTPIFFKKLRRWLIAISGGIIAFGTSILVIPGLVASATGKTIELPTLIQIGTYCIVIGGIFGALGAFLTSLPLEVNPEAKEEAKTEVKEEISKSLENDSPPNT